MTGLTLKLVESPEVDLDCTGLTPLELAGKRPAQLRSHRFACGRRKLSLGDLFEVSGEADGVTLTIEHATSRLHRVGAGMTSGTLHVSGDVGSQLGLRMREGVLRLDGSAGDGVGLGLRGGLIEIAGSVGDGVGGPAPGDVSGMNKGTILIGRHAGARVGERMRRGLIAIGGRAGDWCGQQMIAGSIVVLSGSCGQGLGFGMRRGSIVLAKSGFMPSPTFSLTGEFELAFLPVLTSYLASLKPAWRARLSAVKAVQRWVGDAGGLGEILIAC